MPIPTLEQSTWMDKAECRGVSSEIFFPSHYKSDDAQAGPSSYKAARAYCDRCPVKQECLLFAIRMFPHNDDDHGMWGGMSPRERRVHRKSMRVRKTPTQVRNEDLTTGLATGPTKAIYEIAHG